MCIESCNGKDEAGKAAKKKSKQPVKKTVQTCPAGKKLKKKIEECDGGTNILAKAKKANGGKDPTIKVGTVASGFDGATNIKTGTITINEKDSKCNQIETLIFKLANLSRKKDFDKLDNDAKAGKVSRKDYIRGSEKIEYENMQTILKATDSCKEKWGCKNHTFSFEGFRGAKSFDDYYKNYLAKSHKDFYGKWWIETLGQSMRKSIPRSNECMPGISDS